MRRFQCIKNVNDTTIFVLFRAGKVYSEYVNDSWSELTDDLGNEHIVTKQLLENFKELPGDELLPDPYANDNTPEGYYMRSHAGMLKGCLICAAVGFLGAITLIALFW